MQRKTRENKDLVTYKLKIAQKFYKNIESALGNIYRAARDGKVNIQERDTLIQFAKNVYNVHRVPVIPPDPLQMKDPDSKTIADWVKRIRHEREIGEIEILLKGHLAMNTTVSYLIAELLARLDEMDLEGRRLKKKKKRR